MKSAMMHEQLTINEQSPIIARYYDYDHFTFPWHFHSEYEIIYVKESTGERFVADHMEFFYPGDVILLGHNVPHFMRSSDEYYKEDKSLRVKGVIIQFENDYLSHAISNYTDLNHIKTLLNKSRQGIHFPHPENTSIIKAIEKLPTQKGIKQITGLLLLLDEMAKFKPIRLLGSSHFNKTVSDLMDKRLDKVFSYITLNYTKPILLTEIASIVSMNPAAFCRYFKENSGKSFIQYIQDLRIGYARRLLVGSSMDISQISLECGFNTTSHFNKIFKRVTGFTPSLYRNQFLK